MALRPMGISNAASNLVNSYMMGKEHKARQAETDKQNTIKSLMGSMLMGNATPEQSQQFAELAPQQYVSTSNYLQGQDAAAAETAKALSEGRDIEDLTQMLVLDKEGQDALLQKRIMEVDAANGDSSGSQFLLELEPEQRNKYLQMQAGKYNIAMPDSTKFQQGTGDMSGYAFNPDTGGYTADPAQLARLQAEAEEKSKTEGLLTGKDLAGVNDKVTGLVQGTQEIIDSAKSLEALKERGTPAAQIAAVFKFMKANDPTSTVRESEQGMIYEAEGAMKGFAAKLNQMLGEGGISETNFADLADTAKTIANSAVTSTDESVASYLTVLEESLSPKAYKDMLNRVPNMLEITEAGEETVVDPAIIDNAMTEVDSIMQELGF